MLRNCTVKIKDMLRVAAAKVGKASGAVMARIGKALCAVRVLCAKKAVSCVRGFVVPLAARRTVSFVFMPLAIVYMEALLRLLAGYGHWQGFLFAVLFALSAGFLMNLIMAVVNNGRVSRAVGAALLGVLGVVFALQYFMYQSFKVFMDFDAIITEAGNVIGVFTDTLVMAIIRGIPVILGFLAPLILFLAITGKRLPLYPLCEENPAGVDFPEDAPLIHRVLGWALRATPVTVAAAGLILTVGGQALALGASPNNKAAFYSEYNFNASSQRLGVLPGVCLDMWYDVFGSPLDTEAFSVGGAQGVPAFEIPALPQVHDAAGAAGAGSGGAAVAAVGGGGGAAVAAVGGGGGAAGGGTAGMVSGGAVAGAAGTGSDTAGGGAAGTGDEMAGAMSGGAAGAGGGGDTEPEPAPEPVVYGYNELYIDFDALIENETDSRIIDMHRYVSALTPSRKNAYTGLFEGKNLVIICAEAFTKQVVDPVMTPTLYRLVHNGFYFSDFYQPAWGGGTSGGEFAILSGFPPADSGSMLVAANQNCSYMIGNRLRNLGYFSASYHNGSYTYYSRNESHEKLGYETFQAVGFGIDGYERLRWSASDLEMMQLSIPHYIYRRPFSVYYMTVSGHSPYTFNNQVANKNWDAFPERFSEMSEPIRAYFATNLELEYALAYLVSQLEMAGIADDTVIVLATDHFPYGLERSATWESDGNYLEELFGTPVRSDVERDVSAMILWSGCLENEHKDMAVEISSPTMTLDILPTLLNLFGLDFDSRLFVGRDVFSDAAPLVFWYSRSWKTDAGFFDNRRNEFTPAVAGVSITDEYAGAVRAVVNNKIRYSSSVLSRDYFNTVFDFEGNLR